MNETSRKREEDVKEKGEEDTEGEDMEKNKDIDDKEEK